MLPYLIRRQLVVQYSYFDGAEQQKCLILKLVKILFPTLFIYVQSKK